MKNIINNKTRKTGIVFMLFILLLTGLATSCKKTTCNYAPCTVRDSINISTGRDTIGAVDGNWIVTSSPYPPGRQAIIMPAWAPGMPGGYEPTPITNTNAGWINCTGAACCGSLLGKYTYETTFTITPNTLSFSCDFNTAYDDALVSPIELIGPGSTPTIILLPDPTHPGSVASLNINIGTVVTNPAVGTWKIRATISTADHGTGLLVSGFIKTLKPC